ncbi:hypothetical protein RIF29_10585 [Crotalaria pallida]|uniref:Uncharacterized protein n=1 Tax=Crotalaria pallida TaxID=3830 RepID=A0AAN9IJX9_CROPI
MNTKLSSVSLLLDLRSISPEHKANQRHDNGTSNNNNNDFSKKFGRRNSGYLRYATKAVAKIIEKSNSLRLFHSSYSNVGFGQQKRDTTIELKRIKRLKEKFKRIHDQLVLHQAM